MILILLTRNRNGGVKSRTLDNLLCDALREIKCGKSVSKSKSEK